MSLPRIASREEWLRARTALLEREKDLTRQRDALNAERRSLPMVEVTKAYRLAGPDGEVRLLDLFEGRPQLIVYHFMFHPEWEDGCPSCTAGADELSPGFLEHLHTRDTSYAMVSRAPLAKLERWKAKRGWEIPGTPRARVTSITTSVSRSTPLEASTSSTSARSTSTQPWAKRA